MKSSVRIFLILLFGMLRLAAQPLQVLYPQFSAAYLNSAIPCRSGGFLLGGYVGTTGSGNAVLIRIEENGGIRWSKELSLSNYGEYGISVGEFENGDFALCGRSVTINSQSVWDEDPFVMRTDSLGNPIWTKVYVSDPFCSLDYLITTQDGGVLVTGTFVDTVQSVIPVMAMIKIDSAGNEEFTTILGEFGPGISYSGGCPVEVSPGNFLVAGKWAQSNWPISDSDILVTKLDRWGNPQFIRFFGRSFYAAQEEPLSLRWDGSHAFMVGQTLADGNDLGFLMELDTNGNNLNYQISPVSLKDIALGSNGERWLTGWHYDDLGYSEIDLLHLDTGGGLDWAQQYGINGYSDQTSKILTGNGGRIHVFGHTNSFGSHNFSPYHLIPDPQGITGCNESPLPAYLRDTTVPETLHTYFASAWSFPSQFTQATNQNANFSELPLCGTSIEPVFSDFSEKIYPNPTQGVLFLENPEGTAPFSVEILSLEGKTLKNLGTFSEISASSPPISVTDLPDGMYLVRIQGKAGIHTEKLILQR